MEGSATPPTGAVYSVQAASSAGAGADCALGSREWAEPPQYLPALCWVVLAARNPEGHPSVGGAIDY